MVARLFLNLSFTAPHQLPGGNVEGADAEHRAGRCKHVIAARIFKAKTGTCEGCGGRFPRRDLFEVGDDHLTFFEGDELCRPCARCHGVL